jgi:hypothetical protein
MQEKEISIWLDSYEDIFSDFDPRPYEQRQLSDDFIKEIQRRYLEDPKGRFEVHFILPSSERDLQKEAIVKRRLKEHFKDMVKKEKETIKNLQLRGYIYIIVGAIILLANTAALFFLEERSIEYQILAVLLVPAGWYGMFTGIGKVIDEPALFIEKKEFYEKFEKANYIFSSEERE